MISNSAPVITLLGSNPVNITEGATYSDAGATASDNEDGNLTASIVTSNPVDTAIPGTYTVTYDVTDSDGKSASQVTRTVNVISANTAPVAIILAPSDITAGDTVTLDGSTSFDPDGDTITFDWQFVSVPVGSTLTSANIISGTSPIASFTSDVDGIYEITLEVFDDDLSNVAQHMITAVVATNVPPTADAGANQNVTTGSYVVIDGTLSSDSDAQPLSLSYSWTFDSVPVGSALTNIQIADAMSPVAGFNTDVDGDYVLMLEVFDGEDYATDFVTITATATNTPPSANAGDDQMVVLGDTVTLDGSNSSDPDFGPSALSYSWSFASTPAGSTLSDTDISGSASAYPDFIPDVVGDYLLRLDVSDGVAGDFDQVVIEVGSPPSVPENLIGRARQYHVNLVWDLTVGATSYNIYRKLDSDSGYVHMGTIAADVTVFVDDMPSGTRYADYYIEAENSFGISDPTADVRVFPALRARR